MKAMHLAEKLDPEGFAPTVWSTKRLIGPDFWFVGFVAFFVFVVAFTTILVETFLMATEMAKGKQYSLAIPHLHLLYKVFGEFCAIHGEVEGHTGPGL